MTWYYNVHPDLFFLAGGGDKGFDVYAGKQIGFEEAVGRISGFIFHDVDFKEPCGRQAKKIFMDHFDCPQFQRQSESKISSATRTGHLGPSYQLEVDFKSSQFYSCGLNDSYDRYIEYADLMWAHVGRGTLKVL